jgi:hypothetical protein
LADLKRTKTENLLENRYRKLRSIGNNHTDNRRKASSSSAKIRAMVEAIAKKSKPIPARV